MNKRYLLFISLAILSLNSLFATSNSWTGGGAAGVWEDPNNWSAGVTPRVADDIIIDGVYAVTVSSNSTVETIKLRGCADLTVAATYTLTVSELGSHDGVDVDSCSALVVSGTLNSSLHGGNGIDINEFASLTVTSTGTISVSTVGGDGIEISDNMSNAGTISITNHSKAGLYAKDGDPNRIITNTGTITISGGEYGIDQQNNFFFTNTGTVTLSNASITLIDNGTNFTNKGTFKGDGFVENGDGNDVIFNSGSTVAPGTSVGTLTFDKALDISGVSLDIEIEGASNFDKVIVNTGDLTLTGATLNLSGSYVPVGGEEFMLLEKVSAGAITGNFSGLSEGAMVSFGGSSFTISYLGGDGNDMTMSNDAPLPIELIDFSARAIKDEVKLTWTTATETNNDFFTLERSTDGRTFEEIARILGNGNTTEISKYTYMDKNPRSGLSYYRLKQTDFDGQFAYSDLETVKFESVESISVFPTMVNDVVNIETTMTFEDDLTVVVRDLTGRVFKQIAIDKNENKVEFSLANLVPGSYFITIYNDELFQTHKIIKL